LREEVLRDGDDGLEAGGGAVDDTAELILLHVIAVFQLPVRDAVKVVEERLAVMRSLRRGRLREPTLAGVTPEPRVPGARSAPDRLELQAEYTFKELAFLGIG
jgi:hypothetical protein